MIHVGDEGVQRLAAVLRQVAFRADELIEAVRKDGGDRYHASVKRLEKQLRRTQADLEELEHSMLHGSRSALRTVNRAALDHPYATAGAGVVMGAAIGLLFGMFLSRR
jgi:ElaB/YqjD/DUF883 family membrane-anchored ribosome-binding protein